MKEPLCVTLPIQLIKRIDNDRGDVSRSRFVLRLLEKAYDQDPKGAEE